MKIYGGHRVSGLLRIDEVAEQTGFRARKGTTKPSADWSWPRWATSRPPANRST